MTITITFNQNQGDAANPELIKDDLDTLATQVNTNTDSITELQVSLTTFQEHISSNPLDHEDGSVTDVKFGNRTIDDSLVPSSNTGELTTLFGNIANRLVNITGETTWKDDCSVSLNTLDARTSIEYQSDSSASDIPGMVSDFNDLLAKLRTAGIMVLPS